MCGGRGVGNVLFRAAFSIALLDSICGAGGIRLSYSPVEFYF